MKALPPPTPDEIDSLLANIAATGYSSTAVAIVEDWIEQRYGVVGDFARKLREEQAAERSRLLDGDPWLPTRPDPESRP